MKAIVTLFLFAFAAPAFAEPTQMAIITPESVKLVGKTVVVVYSAPCQTDPAMEIVTANDDSGDFVFAVGVLASMEERSCHPGALQTFTWRLPVKRLGITHLDDAMEFVPMDTLPVVVPTPSAPLPHAVR